jgi:PIN domain nuclease of toxin-antitoxin system
MNLLLDTCALLWLASEDEHLSATARERIESAPVTYVSVMSGFEIALKWRRGKLELPATPDEWFTSVLQHHGLTAVPVEMPDALRAPLLPDVHRDPCDRFIIACALRLGAAVVTADTRFAAYGIPVVA